MADSKLEITPGVYAEAFRSSTDGIIITDPRGRIVTANPAWLELHGYTLEEVVGETTRIVRGPHTDNAMYDYMWSRISDPAQRRWQGEIVNRTRDGRELPLLLSITPIHVDGDLVGYMGVSIDIRERKQFEEFRRLYEMVVRHDLKAPLSAVQTLLGVLVGGHVGELDGEQRELVERALAKADAMRALIDTSLDIEKLRRRTISLSPEEVDLADIVRATFDTLSGLAERREVTLSLRGDAMTRQLDPLHTQRCTDNLVKNAVEAAPRGSQVVVTLAEDDGAAVLSVHNGGDPIPPDIRATLFHPFSTYGKRGGTGLGIYGVKLTVEAMGGTVSYRSDAEGTTFQLHFP